MRIISLFFGTLLATTLLGDSIVLKDGSRLEGTIKRTDAGWQVTAVDGKVTVVPLSNVKSIELGSRAAGSQSSAAALASLRRSVEAMSDLVQIIERYERFITNTKDSAVVENAQTDLAIWLDRRARGLVKQGSNWVTPEQAEQLRGQALELVAQARDLLRQGQVPKAEELLQKSLTIDPNNAAGLYLRAVLLFRQDKVVDARKLFETVNATVPNHAPTLNNLAIILWRQNAVGAAMAYFDQAMQAQPVNKFILDNVAEALGTVEDNHRKAQVTQRVVRRFSEQDTLLQKQLAAQGLYRWGAAWIDQRQLDELKAAEKEVQERLAKVESDFESARRRLADNESRIRSNEQQMREMEYNRLSYRDSNGNTVILPLPQVYYDLKRENESLRYEQRDLQNRFDQLRDVYKRTRQQLPAPKYSGMMQIVGLEGIPLLPEPQPQPQPATAPSGA